MSQTDFPIKDWIKVIEKERKDERNKTLSEVRRTVEEMNREYWRIPAPKWLGVGQGMDGYTDEIKRRLAELEAKP